VEKMALILPGFNKEIKFNSPDFNSKFQQVVKNIKGLLKFSTFRYGL